MGQRRNVKAGAEIRRCGKSVTLGLAERKIRAYHGFVEPPKECVGCGDTKPVEAFAKTGKGRRERWCKACRSASVAEKQRAKRRMKDPALNVLPELEAEVRGLIEQDDEAARLAHVGSTWAFVERMLEMRGAPKTLVGARRLVGPEFPIDDAAGKPRDPQGLKADLAEVERTSLGDLKAAERVKRGHDGR